MNGYIFHGGKVLDVDNGTLRDGLEVHVEGDRIVRVSSEKLDTAGVERIDLKGRTLMPGLIDAHVHVIATLVDLAKNAELPSSLIALRSREIMHEMLMRGFTTVRDLAGADLGLKLAVEEGLIDGPRLVICGKALSQTVGHCDYRARNDKRQLHPASLGALGRIADGVDEVRRATRDEIKGGADFIKIMANGGVSSPNDPIHVLQYSRDEIRVIVEEAENYGLYVAAHTYSDASIRRAVECGVKSLEHCNLITLETAKFAAEAGAIACPTLAAYEGLALDGAAFGLSADSQAKIETVRTGGLESLRLMKEAGLPMGFGTDLLGQLHKYQSMEFEIRAKVLTAHDILYSASRVSSRLCMMENQIGVISEGAYADFVVVNGNPLEDVTILSRPEKNLAAIVRGGKFYKNTLAA
ncbi:amidohydrolase family protein (plasmid) [Sinorhizobium numidicum]|uniref:Amidohydrolase family protein n=1 Tax=Sinorhizobium numidicum TaxID=680248 RepID=A0ABY8D3H1_9HYPH|nr:amidohydrolase family protein [Sinorhizobium numidicum]WEX79613.1 amidohydrolase family protein [Sinorhizobium numidicum]WEX85431.1 amidohydrolase family protein [Sinorhizobium numidicum]